MQIPALNMTGWTVLDFELALAGLRSISSACSALANQPRALHGHEYHPGADFIVAVGDDWCGGAIDAVIERLETLRFPDAKDDERRILLLINYRSGHGSASDPLAQIIQMALDQSVRPAV